MKAEANWPQSRWTPVFRAYPYRRPSGTNAAFINPLRATPQPLPESAVSHSALRCLFTGPPPITTVSGQLGEGIFHSFAPLWSCACETVTKCNQTAGQKIHQSYPDYPILTVFTFSTSPISPICLRFFRLISDLPDWATLTHLHSWTATPLPTHSCILAGVQLLAVSAMSYYYPVALLLLLTPNVFSFTCYSCNSKVGVRQQHWLIYLIQSLNCFYMLLW